MVSLSLPSVAITTVGVKEEEKIWSSIDHGCSGPHAVHIR